MKHRIYLAQFFKECLAKEDLMAKIFEGEKMLYNPTDDEGDLEDRGKSVLAEGHKRKREDEDSVSGETMKKWKGKGREEEIKVSAVDGNFDYY